MSKNSNQTDKSKKLLYALRKKPGNLSNVSKRAKIAWSTGRGILQDMIADGLIYIDDNNNVRPVPSYAFEIGISVGKQTTSFVCLDFAHRFASIDRLHLSPSAERYLQDNFQTVGDKHEAVWTRNTPSDALTSIGDMLVKLCEIALEINEQTPVLSIGIVFGDHVDHRTNTIIRWSILENPILENVDIGILLNDSLVQRLDDAGIAIQFDHNSRAALFAELELENGCLKNMADEDGVLVYMGSGIGCSFYINGKVVRGASNACGSRLGHVQVLTKDKQNNTVPCHGCGSRCCLEAALYHVFGSDYKKESAATLVSRLNQDNKAELAEVLAEALLREAALFEFSFIVFSGKLALVFPEVKRLFRAKASERQLKSTMITQASSLDGEIVAGAGAALCGYHKWLSGGPD